jgi:hypothetical protein
MNCLQEAEDELNDVTNNVYEGGVSKGQRNGQGKMLFVVFTVEPGRKIDLMDLDGFSLLETKLLKAVLKTGKLLMGRSRSSSPTESSMKVT